MPPAAQFPPNRSTSNLFKWVLGLLFFSLCRPAARAASGYELIFPEAEWATPDIIRVPFTLTGTLITVQARADTVAGNFFFDTGSSSLLLNSRHFRNANRTAATGAGGGGVTGRVQLQGSTKVDTFEMDNLLTFNVDATLVDLSHLENAKKVHLVGIIGYEVFQDFEVLFDYNALRLTLIRVNSRGRPFTPLPEWEYKPGASFPLEVVGHVAVLRLKFGAGPAVKFALDSGAEQNLLSNTAGRRFLKKNFEIRNRTKLRGVGEAGIEVLNGLLHNARLDTFSFKPMATILTNLSQINAAYQTEVAGVLGYEFLSQRPMSINPKKRRLTFYTQIRP